LIFHAPEIVRFSTDCTATPGMQYYGLFRSARQSLSSVEEFMHLCHILLMLYNDSQSEVDQFIESQEPGVQKALSSHTKKMETIYTQLRNEFAHARTVVDLDQTKSKMGDWIPKLVALTKWAIELHS
jgi:hypothetical protein